MTDVDGGTLGMGPPGGILGAAIGLPRSSGKASPSCRLAERAPTIQAPIAEHAYAIHLIASSRVPLHPLLIRALGGAARIAFWESDIARLTVKARDIVVVDLLDGGPSIPCAALAPLARRADVWLVIGRSPVLPDWMEIALQPGTHVIRCSRDPGSLDLDRFVMTLERRLRTPTVEELVSLILERNPRLLRAREFVTAILAHPWEARHPTQLALLSGRPLANLKATCRALGFRRAEHFMVAIRRVAVDQLSSYRGLSAPAARQLAGVADTSNFRRQLKRAARGSRDGLEGLQTCRTQPADSYPSRQVCTLVTPPAARDHADEHRPGHRT